VKASDLDPATLRWVADELERDGGEHWRSAIKWRMPERGDHDQAEWHEGVFRVLLGHVKRLRNRATRIERKWGRHRYTDRGGVSVCMLCGKVENKDRATPWPCEGNPPPIRTRSERKRGPR
jgi:hypothetical protein